MWIPLDTLTLSNSWQLCPESEYGLYRLTPLTESLSPLGNVTIGKYEVGQFDTDGTGYAIRAFRREAFGVVLQFAKPRFFETQRIGLRVPTGFYPFDLQVDVNDMPFSNLGNTSSATTATTTVVPASVTAVTIAAANPERKMLMITNSSTKSLYLDFDGDVTATAFAVEVKANIIYEMPIGFAGEIKGIWAASATGSCKVVEFS
jgi:hypothetical protein